jgi:hypothetical protein
MIDPRTGRHWNNKAMTDLNYLDADTRCLVMVGKFLQKWAIMETALCTALQTALELDGFQTSVIASNTQLREKIGILRIIVSNLPFDKNEIEQFDKTLTQISKARYKRNVMAHDTFEPSPDGKGVCFSVTRAEGRQLSSSEMIWDIARFEAEFTQMERLTDGVTAIINAINQKGVIKRMRETALAHPWTLYYLQDPGPNPLLPLHPTPS